MMIEDYSWFILRIVLNTLSVVQYYFTTCSFGGHGFDFTKKGMIKNVMLALAYGLVAASIIEFSDNTFIIHFVLNFSIFLWVMYFTKRNVFENIIISAMLILKLAILQTIVLFVLQQMNLDQRVVLLIAQVVVVSSIIFISLKFKLYQLFLWVQQKAYLKVSIYLIMAIILTVMALTGFEIQYTWEWGLLFGISIIVILLGIVLAVFSVQTQVDQSTDKYHDVVNMFMGLYLSIESEEDIEELKRQSREIKEYLTGRSQLATNLTSSHEQSLKALLQDKLAMTGKINELIFDIGYYQHHKKVSFSKVTSMLGTLFDNALEHGLDGPISVYLKVSELLLELTVKNSCQELSDKQLNQLFKKGYSTQEKTGHGHGLYKLEKDVKGYKDEYFISEILVETYYDMKYENDYLEITINISPKHIILNQF